MIMGLDNGINFKILDKEVFGELPNWIRREAWEDQYGFDYEVFYWRKCWNVRNAIIGYLGMHDNEYECTITVYDLENITNILERKIYGKDKWEDSLSIWTWEESGEFFTERLEYARKIVEWLKTKPFGSFELYFYDSY